MRSRFFLQTIAEISTQYEMLYGMLSHENYELQAYRHMANMNCLHTVTYRIEHSLNPADLKQHCSCRISYNTQDMKNVHPQLCSTHENQELLASTVANFGAWLHTHIVHYLVEEVTILIIDYL